MSAPSSFKSKLVVDVPSASDMNANININMELQSTLHEATLLFALQQKQLAQTQPTIDDQALLRETEACRQAEARGQLSINARLQSDTFAFQWLLISANTS